jgi:outer membrane protein TolC
VRTQTFSRHRVVLAAVVVAAVNAAGAEQPKSRTPVDPEHLTLDVAEQLFREHSRELLAAKQAVEAAEADRVIATQRPNPKLSVGASQLRPTGAPRLDSRQTHRHGCSPSQLIERGDKRQFRTEAAQNTRRQPAICGTSHGSRPCHARRVL